MRLLFSDDRGESVLEVMGRHLRGAHRLRGPGGRLGVLYKWRVGLWAIRSQRPSSREGQGRDREPERQPMPADQRQWLEAVPCGEDAEDFRLRCRGSSHDWAGRLFIRASDAQKAGCDVCAALAEGRTRLAVNG